MHIHLAGINRDIACDDGHQFLLELRQEIFPIAANALMRQHNLKPFLGGNGAIIRSLATEETQPACPRSVRVQRPLATSHSFSVQS